MPSCSEMAADGDAEFLGFLACWDRDERCPLPLADWLRDRGMDRQAAAAEWAATFRDRRAGGNLLDGRYQVIPTKSGPFPTRNVSKGQAEWRWYASLARTAAADSEADDVPMPGGFWHHFDTLPKALAWLLDNVDPTHDAARTGRAGPLQNPPTARTG